MMQRLLGNRQAQQTITNHEEVKVELKEEDENTVEQQVAAGFAEGMDSPHNIAKPIPVK